jgi:DNA-binding beta-propeller fold protein YncE
VPNVNYNPGEPVFDQTTGEPYITEDGELVEVSPGLIVNASDGRALDGDDVANAAFWHGNLYLGESLRDESVGVPYLQEALGGSNAALAAAVVVGEVRERTPGVAGIVGVTVQGIDPVSRVLSWQGVVLRQDGTEQEVASSSGV